MICKLHHSLDDETTTGDDKYDSESSIEVEIDNEVH